MRPFAAPLLLALFAFAVGVALPNTWFFYIAQTVGMCLGMVILCTAGFRRLALGS